jgi:glycosyltransferase involved in cell wall biosynthesis
MHICFSAIDYHSATSGGGIGSYIDTLAPELLSGGHAVSILALSDRNETKYEDGILLLRVRKPNLHWHMHKLCVPSAIVIPTRELEWSYAMRLALRELLIEHDVDVVETSETGILCLSFWRGRDFPPLVVRLHGDQYVSSKYTLPRIPAGHKVGHRLKLMALRQAAGVTSPSAYQAEEVAQDLAWPTSRIKVLANPVSPVFLNAPRPGTKSEDTKQTDIVLSTGRLELRKGTLVLLRSIPHVVKKVPNVEFVLAGSRHSSIDDRTLNEHLSAVDTGHTRLLGHVPWNSLSDWYRQARLLVMPSYYETFGISAIEAMSFGLPVVATRVGGLSEVVEDGVTGLLVPPDDPIALGEAIQELLRDPRRCAKYGAAGRDKVRSCYTPERIARETLRFYESVLSAPLSVMTTMDVKGGSA